MEALASLGINWKLLLAQVVNFLILLFILKKLLYGPVVNILTERKKAIAKAQEDASQAEEALKNAESQSREKISEAVNEAQKIIDEARKQASAASRSALEKASIRAKAIIEEAKEAASSENQKALERARRELAGLVTMATEKILSEKVDQKDTERVISRI